MAKRDAVGWLLETYQASLRRACRLVALSTATWRYQHRGRVDNTQLLARLQAHAAERPRFGYRRLHTLVEREGLVVNHQRVPSGVSGRAPPGPPPAAEASDARRTAPDRPAARPRRTLVHGLYGGHAGRRTLASPAQCRG